MQCNSEAYLWTLFKKGDKHAYEQIYRTYACALLCYGRKLCLNEQLVEDSLQDLFIELWNSRERVSNTTSIKFYLFRALRYKIQRNRSKSFDLESDSVRPFMVLSSPSHEEAIIEREGASSQTRHINELLENLPERQREAIMLRYFHDFSNEEISGIMGIQYNSVCKFIRAALKNLKDCVKIAVQLAAPILSLFSSSF